MDIPKEERLEQTAADFSSLTGQNQDYVLGIMQALFFAKHTAMSGQTDGETVGDVEEIRP
jgi:hypothetical protein